MVVHEDNVFTGFGRTRMEVLVVQHFVSSPLLRLCWGAGGVLGVA